MAIEREELLQQIDGLKEKSKALFDELDKLSLEADELRKTRREFEEKNWAAEEKVKETEAKVEELQTKISELESEIEAKNTELAKTKEHISNTEAQLEERIGEIIKERDDLKSEMDEITTKLERVSELYRETSAEKEKLEEKVDVSDLLGIYIMLIENIFGGKPHARVLYTLHNTGAAIPRKNIETSTGIMSTAVLKAIYDLRNAELVSYDEETQEVKLIKEIL